MKHSWENNGEPNEEGQFVAVVDMEDGSRPQRFIGASHKEVADKLLNAQLNATAEISRQRTELRKLSKLTPAPAEARPLTADERFQLGQDLQDPAKAPEAITRIVETTVPKEDEDTRTARAVAETKLFMERTPEFYPCPHNKAMMLNYMQMPWTFATVEPHEDKPLACTASNLCNIFERLKAAGLLLSRPQAPTQQPEPSQEPIPPAVTTRPRGATPSSSGIRNADSSVRPTAVRTQRPKYTVAEIEAMSSEEYNKKLANEPGFAQLVNEAYSGRTAAAR